MASCAPKILLPVFAFIERFLSLDRRVAQVTELSWIQEAYSPERKVKRWLSLGILQHSDRMITLPVWGNHIHLSVLYRIWRRVGNRLFEASIQQDMKERKRYESTISRRS
jgi:hypothetical protein